MLRPLNDLIVIKPDKPDEISVGGIVLPNQTQKNQRINRGTIIVTGPGKLGKNGERMPMDVKVGDKVLYNWGGHDVEYGKETYRIMRADDAVAILE